MQENLTTAEDALESVHPGASAQSQPVPDGFIAGDLTSPEPVPGSPQWLAQALRTYAPQMERMGLSHEQRPPFLRDLFALVTAALDMVDRIGMTDEGAGHARTGRTSLGPQPPFDT